MLYEYKEKLGVALEYFAYINNREFDVESKNFRQT